MEIELSASLVTDPDITAFSLILRDITARKASEKALMASEERYELAAIGANDGLWDWDLVNGWGIYYSPAGRPCWAVGMADPAVRKRMV